MAHKDITIDLTKHPFGPAVILIVGQLRRRLRDYVNLRPGLGYELDSANLTHLLEHHAKFSWSTVEQAVRCLERANSGPHAIKECGLEEIAAARTIPLLLDISDEDCTVECARKRLIPLIRQVFAQVEKAGLVSFDGIGYSFEMVVGVGEYAQKEIFSLEGLTCDESTKNDIELAALNPVGDEITFPLDELSVETLAEVWDYLQEMTPVGD